MEIRQANEQEDAVLVRHYLGVWKSYNRPPVHFEADAVERVQAFIEDARRNHDLGVFLALVGETPVGSAACQFFRSPYPEVIRPDVRRFGYIWSVFVEPEHRGKGLARALTRRAIDHLSGIGCTAAVLHASEAGLPVYAGLGFEPANEMRLLLKP